MTDDVRTFAEVAKWLPHDIVDAIEVTLGCVNGAEHNWDVTEIHAFGQLEPVLTHWTCRRCHVSLSRNPETVIP